MMSRSIPGSLDFFENKNNKLLSSSIHHSSREKKVGLADITLVVVDMHKLCGEALGCGTALLMQ
jgi:hypothetical protein